MVRANENEHKSLKWEMRAKIILARNVCRCRGTRQRIILRLTTLPQRRFNLKNYIYFIITEIRLPNVVD